MISIYQMKPAFQNLLRPLSHFLVKKGVTANQITVAAILLSFVAGLLLTLFPESHSALLFVPLALLLRMVLNALDGMIAREHCMQSSLGVFLNELGDVMSDIFIFLPFALIPHISATIVVLVVLFAIVSEMCGVVAIQAGTVRHYEGPMGKSDRAFVFGLLGFVLGIGLPATIWVNLVLVVVVLALLLTIFNRIKNALKELTHAS